MLFKFKNIKLTRIILKQSKMKYILDDVQLNLLEVFTLYSLHLCNAIQADS